MSNIDLNWLKVQFPNLSSIEPLETGGQKSVFKAKQKSGFPVVLKLFHPGTTTDRVEREILATKVIRSKRIPSIESRGKIASPLGEIDWILEQFIEGVTLRKVMDSRQLIDKEILKLGLHLLEALTAAESNNIIHRDVKPLNILIDASSNFWLLDFGIARHLDLTSLTPSDFNRGACSAGYAPLEQFENRKADIDSKTDLFAVGVVIYEACEQKNPFLEGASSVNEVYRRMQKSQLPKISKIVDQKGELANLVLAMTRNNRQNRPKTVSDALVWMQEICLAEGVQ